MREFSLAIVGAGIAGASLAYRVPGPGTVLLERESQPGYHSTGRSAAMFMETYGPPMVCALTRASRRFYEAPPPGFAQSPLLAPRGALYVAAPGQAGLLDTMQAALESAGGVIERLDAGAALAMAPCLRPEAVQGALYERDAQDIDVGALHQGFLRGFRQGAGTVLANAGVVSAWRENGMWALQLASGETIHARAVVNAAGAWADDVARLFGAQPAGLEPRRRSAFTFKAPQGQDTAHWPAVVGADEGWYFKPDAGQLLGSPANADPVPAHDVVPEELDIAIGIDRIQAATTLEIRRPTATWAGLRTFSPDGEMVIGWDEQVDGLFWLAGQGGYGIQSAAGASLLAASLLRGEPLPAELRQQSVDAALLSPRRFRAASPAL